MISPLSIAAARARLKAADNVVQLHPQPLEPRDDEAIIGARLLDETLGRGSIANPALDAALYIASLGGRIFPLPDGRKAPPPKGWQRMATSDPEQITAWLKNGGNYGVATGNGWIVLDLDRKGGVDGVASLRELEAEHGILPATLKVRTPTGGEHWYFFSSRPVRSSAGRIAPGIDVRGEGGYVVGPGSSTEHGAYEWIVDA